MRRSCAKFACGLAASLVLVLTGAATAGAGGPVEIPFPHVFSGFVVDPSPLPSPKEGRVPTSLRFTDTIWTDDDSQPPALEELQLSLDRRFRLDLSDTPNQGELGSGPIRFEVASAEGKATKVGATATAYKGRRGTMLIRAKLGAPVEEEVVIPVKLGRMDTGSIYGVRLTASIPQVADGSASLVYLGLRFRTGVFSIACTKGRIQSGLTQTFADGTQLSGALLSTC